MGTGRASAPGMRESLRDGLLGTLSLLSVGAIWLSLQLPEPPRTRLWTPAEPWEDAEGDFATDPDPLPAEPEPEPEVVAAAAVAPEPAPRRRPAAPLSADEQTELLGLLWDRVDHYRKTGARCGDRATPPAPRLRGSVLLDDAAASQASWMAESGDRDHVVPGNPAGRTPADRVISAGFPGGLAGEVLAWGQATPRAAADWWIRSPSHCEVLLDPDATHGGAAVVREPATGDLLWVIVLGRR